MKIYSVSNSFNNSVVQNHNSTGYYVNTGKTSFDKISFGELRGHWDQKALRILDRTPEEMHELAEYFHKTPVIELEKVATIRGLFGVRLKTKSLLAFYKLKEAIMPVIAYRDKISKELTSLYTKKDIVKLNDIELARIDQINKEIDKLDTRDRAKYVKFFYKEDNPSGHHSLLSDSDIAYFNRYNNDY